MDKDAEDGCEEQRGRKAMSDTSAIRQEPRAVQRPWLASYPQGIPVELPDLGYTSLAELLERSCKQFADRKAFSSMGKSITYRELEEQTRAIGGWLQSIGLQKGDRVAVMMPNILQNPVATYAILRAGLTVVNVNPLYTRVNSNTS